MKVIRVIASEIQTNSYLLLCEKPAIIDPGSRLGIVLDNLRKHTEENPEYIILTHYHFDHTDATPKVREETNAEALIHELDAKFLDFVPDKTLRDKDILDLGDVELRVIHTPGHTEGSICLYEPRTKSLFSGDTVFPHGSFGRTDLKGGDTEKLKESLESLCELDVRILYPGHGEVTKERVNEQIKNSLELARTLL